MCGLSYVCVLCVCMYYECKRVCDCLTGSISLRSDDIAGYYL